MRIFKRIVAMVTADTAGRDAAEQPTPNELAERIEVLALNDPELAEYYRRKPYTPTELHT